VFNSPKRLSHRRSEFNETGFVPGEEKPLKGFLGFEEAKGEKSEISMLFKSRKGLERSESL